MSEFTGKKLREARVKKGLSQDEAANLMIVAVVPQALTIWGAERIVCIKELLARV